MITAKDFRLHVESKNKQTKGEIAKHLYGPYTYDTALPIDWVTKVQKETGYKDVASHFVWIYMHNHYTGPAPLTIEGCNILAEIE